MDRGSTATASVTSTSGATYAWTVTNGTVASGAGTPSITFQASCATTSVGVAVTVTAGCGAASSSEKTVTLNAAATVTVDGSVTIAQGSSTDIQATLTGAAPWSIVWQDESSARSAATSPAMRTVTPVGTTTYRASSVTDTYGCAGTALGSGFVVTVTPPPPSGVSASAVTSTRVDLVWNFSGTADSFDIERRAGGAYAKVGSSTTRSYSDTAAAPNTAYLYRVRAVKSGTSSEPSVQDLATTVIFADDPLFSGQTPIRAQHILDLRTAVNAVRTTAGLPQSSFTDATLAGVSVKAVYIQELRTALDGARAQLLLSPLSYTDQPLANGLFIKRVHVDQVRGGVK